MGIDIHGFVEYRQKPDPKMNRSYAWQSYSAELDLGRNYEIFGILGQVRGGNNTSICDGRGIPRDLGVYSKMAVHLKVVEDNGYDGSYEAERREVDRTDAEMWVSRGHSKWLDEGNGPVDKWVTDPDFHNHSWCTPHELEQCLHGGFIEFSNMNNIDYSSTLFLMKYIEAMENEVRLVYWFDS